MPPSPHPAHKSHTHTRGGEEETTLVRVAQIDTILHSFTITRIPLCEPTTTPSGTHTRTPAWTSHPTHRTPHLPPHEG
eukprot:m.427637 g.427637  ORF g.427637 m.427637 type:complete len:78 (-) comp64900_c0_seq1:12-245(-)